MKLKPETLSSLYVAIAHGDDAHKAWLREALNNWNEDKPLPDADPPRPVSLVITCPSCGVRHVDKGTFATKAHHTHACQGCGMVWRPAIGPTVGVQFLPGFKDD